MVHITSHSACLPELVSYVRVHVAEVLLISLYRVASIFGATCTCSLGQHVGSAESVYMGDYLCS